MKKHTNTILVATLNHNLPELTENLVEQIKREQYLSEDKYEIMCVDNGSLVIPKCATHQIDENLFFGGGTNTILDYFLRETKHEWLYLLNNDLIFHGFNFLSLSLKEAIESKAQVYSPTVINASVEQCCWKQMWNWGSKTPRTVEWIDFQCPLIHRSVLEKIQQFPHELHYGWGLDVYTGIICKENKWKTVVSDTNTICHLNSQTFKQHKINIGVQEFCQRAETAQNNFFYNSDMKYDFIKFRENAKNYEFII